MKYRPRFREHFASRFMAAWSRALERSRAQELHDRIGVWGIGLAGEGNAQEGAHIGQQ